MISDLIKIYYYTLQSDFKSCFLSYVHSKNKLIQV